MNASGEGRARFRQQIFERKCQDIFMLENRIRARNPVSGC